MEAVRGWVWIFSGIAHFLKCMLQVVDNAVFGKKYCYI